jgi:glutamine amidotransferase
MCRLVIYKGSPLPLHKLIIEPPHSLIRQSYDAREMLSGSMNADGFGIGWYQPDLDPAPAVYTNPQPIWNDANLPRMANKISSGIIFGHVRGASEGMPVNSANTHPFGYKNFMFMHNGSIDEFRSKVYPEIASRIRPELWDHIKGNTDSEHVFGLWLSYLGATEDRAYSLEEQTEALRKTIAYLETIAEREKIDIVLNIGITDGVHVIATRYHFGKRKATLYYVENAADYPASVVIASEKFNEDPAWRPVPERSIITIDTRNRLVVKGF